MNIEAFFFEHPVFRFEEFKNWKHTQGTETPSAIHSALRYYLKSGRIKLLRRELYGVIPPNESLDTITYDPYLIAAKATNDSILSHHTSLEIHGVAYSSFEQFTFISSKKVKPFEMNGQLYRPVATPIELKNENLENFSVQILNRQGVNIKITNLARTYVDVIDRADLSGGWEEVCRSLDNIAVLNVNDVVNYCLTLKNANLISKVGFFLEQREGPFSVPSENIMQLKKHISNSVQYMSDHSKEPHRLIKQWNLMVPTSVLDRTWNEPQYDE